MINKLIILFKIILGLAGSSLFIWTTLNKHIELYYLIHFLIIFLSLTVISLVLWRNSLFVSYLTTIIFIFYFFFLIIDAVDDSFWFYYTFLFLPMGVLLLAHIAVIEFVLRKYLLKKS